MIDENFENAEVQTIQDIDHFVTTYKSIFYAMTASAESKSEVFSRRIIVNMSDLSELYDRITSKLDVQFKNAGSKVTINVSFNGKRNYFYDNWNDFSNRDWYENQPITSIIIKWEYHILIPEYPVPQPHILVVKVSDGLKPEQLLNLVFTGKIENIERIEEELYPVVARVDYINHELGNELLHIVSEWDKGCTHTNLKKNKFIIFLRKNKFKVSQIMSGLLRILVLFFSMFLMNAYINSLTIQNFVEISTPQLSLFIDIIFFVIVLFSIIKKLTSFLSDIFLQYIGDKTIYHVFNIDKGDKELQQKISEQINANSRKALLSFFISIILNIICGIFASIIFTKLF